MSISKENNESTFYQLIINPATNLSNSDSTVATKLLADHYESVLTNSTPVPVLESDVPLLSFTNVDITWDSIYNNLRKAKKNLSAGCDNIPSIFIVHCAASLSEPL